MELIFTPDGSGTNRATGYATLQYSSDAENETVVETSEEELAGVFQNAKSSGSTLDGAEETIDAAIEDPLRFRDYLVHVDGTIEFDDGYVRESPDGTTSS